LLTFSAIGSQNISGGIVINSRDTIVVDFLNVAGEINKFLTANNLGNILHPDTGINIKLALIMVISMLRDKYNNNEIHIVLKNTDDMVKIMDMISYDPVHTRESVEVFANFIKNENGIIHDNFVNNLFIEQIYLQITKESPHIVDDKLPYIIEHIINILVLNNIDKTNLHVNIAYNNPLLYN
jgi:hypothetical protein